MNDDLKVLKIFLTEILEFIRRGDIQTAQRKLELIIYKLNLKECD